MLTAAAELSPLLAGHLQQLEGRLAEIALRDWRVVAAQRAAGSEQGQFSGLIAARRGFLNAEDWARLGGRVSGK
jgi:hypothetical protein